MSGAGGDVAMARMAPRPVLGVGAMLGTTIMIPLMGLFVKLAARIQHRSTVEILTSGSGPRVGPAAPGAC